MSDSSSRRPGSVSWFRRLSFRITLLWAASLFAFYFATTRNYEGLSSLLGFSAVPEDTFLIEEGWMERSFLMDARKDEGGRWIPDENAFDGYVAFQAGAGVSIAWLDTNDEVVCASESLSFAPGTLWSTPSPPARGTKISSDPDAFNRTTSIRAVLEGEFAGTLISILTDPNLHATVVHGVDSADQIELDACEFGIDQAVFLTKAEYDRRIGSDAFWRRVLSLSVIAVLSLLTVFAVSRLVTRRLSRLADQVSRYHAGHEESFEATGSDEIAALALAMNDMRARLGKALDELSERDEKRREWIAQVSHDLRTPLTALTACLGRSELLFENEQDPQLLARLKDLLTVAKLDADRVNALADDLLDIARLDTGEELHIEPVPPGELIRQALQVMSPVAQAKGVELSCEVPAGMEILQADGRRLMRALENVLRNGIHHARREVCVRASSKEGRLLLETLDDGEGFPTVDGRVDLARFQRQHSKSDSAGLGLLVTQRVAEAHGGSVGAYNLDTGGAAVWLAIPFAGEAGRSPGEGPGNPGSTADVAAPDGG